MWLWPSWCCNPSPLSVVLPAVAPSKKPFRSDLVGKGGVVGEQRRHRARENVAVAVLVLQPFAVERGPAGRRAEQKALRLAVGRRPDEVADALEAEHRIEDVKQI